MVVSLYCNRSLINHLIFIIMNVKILNKYPEKIQQEIISILSCFDRCEISFYNGSFHVSANYSLLSEYPSDFRVCEELKNSDLFTKDELIENYKNL